MPTKYLSRAKIEKLCCKNNSLSDKNRKKLVEAIVLAQRLAAQKGPEAVYKILRELC